MAEDLVGSFERSLQSCIALLGVDTLDKGKGKQYVENKAGVEASITRFLDSGKLLEDNFVKKQASVRVHHPHETLKQEISHMKVEIKQKEDLLSKLSEKVDHWSKILDDLQRKQRTELEIANGASRTGVAFNQGITKMA